MDAWLTGFNQFPFVKYVIKVFREKHLERRNETGNEIIKCHYINTLFF